MGPKGSSRKRVLSDKLESFTISKASTVSHNAGSKAAEQITQRWPIIRMPGVTQRLVYAQLKLLQKIARRIKIHRPQRIA